MNSKTRDRPLPPPTTSPIVGKVVSKSKNRTDAAGRQKDVVCSLNTTLPNKYDLQYKYSCSNNLKASDTDINVSSENSSILPRSGDEYITVGKCREPTHYRCESTTTSGKGQDEKNNNQLPSIISSIGNKEEDQSSKIIADVSARQGRNMTQETRADVAVGDMSAPAVSSFKRDTANDKSIDLGNNVLIMNVVRYTFLVAYSGEYFTYRERLSLKVEHIFVSSSTDRTQ